MSIEKDWLCNAYDRINLGISNIESIHIDELLHIDVINASSNEKLNFTIRTFNAMCEILEVKKDDNCLFFINVGLKDISNKIQRVIRDENELIRSIDKVDVPEIFLVKHQMMKEIPQLEFYRCPIPFDITGLNKCVMVVYKEFRSLEEMYAKYKYSRELNIVYRSLD